MHNTLKLSSLMMKLLQHINKYKWQIEYKMCKLDFFFLSTVKWKQTSQTLGMWLLLMNFRILENENIKCMRCKQLFVSEDSRLQRTSVQWWTWRVRVWGGRLQRSPSRVIQGDPWKVSQCWHRIKDFTLWPPATHEPDTDGALQWPDVWSD